MDLEIVNAKTKQSYGSISVKSRRVTFGKLRHLIHENLKETPQASRQSLGLNPCDMGIKNAVTLESLSVHSGDKIYIIDLGPQIAWKTVFVAEYAGPLIVYLIFYLRPEFIYGKKAGKSISLTTHIAAVCYILHYVKRLLETIFVHRFSHATMPLRNLFKNCSYYWGFTVCVSYQVNHPFYSSPGMSTVWLALGSFALCEQGNLSIHLALRNLRPPGTSVRKIPVPDHNPLTKLFNLVSCPNYTYEIGTWLSFSVMTSCTAAYLFAFVGTLQMIIWSMAKQRKYLKEFKDYPQQRRCIFPYVL
ncbi:uncharacterized protein Dwil_GK15900 [Drosophila willistoni]|uniref:3-oxo-5-alpha-steroid 4-dehydrogenase C-terminal domain-containing protein n=1 Tax=Drosophila willistoni TaxID=7260 RepID=B4MRV7_DROWI|nr:very-long-chain enoyl-CoA reductase-like [Drosophila willistoni]EDW74846.1 uncharacterized protein Dwil_GK15900 [Drosophila willistoni]